MKWVVVVGAAWMLALAGCGSSIGDACTSDQDCGGRTCDTSFAGGYCTQHCTAGDDSTCATGSSCEPHHETNVCLRSCNEDVECRSGLTCHTYRGAGPFCLPPGVD